MKDFIKNYGYLMGVVGTVLGIVGIVQLFNSEALWVKIVIVVSIFILIAFLSIFITIIQIRRGLNLKNGFIGDKSIMVQENKKYILGMYNDQEYSDVCNIGPVYSRVFYIAAAYTTRIEVAKKIYEAADKLGRKRLCATTLLDLGWTMLLLRNFNTEPYSYNGIDFDNPDDYFNESIKYASEIGDKALISKANRHLSGYFLTIGNFQESTKYRNKACTIIEDMENGTDKKSYMADLIYCDAETAFMREKFDKAKKLSAEADELKKTVNDETREIRYYAQMGKIELMLNKPKEAMGLFNLGLAEAKRLKRLDEITKNTYGLALCYIRNGQRREASELVNHMIKKYGKIPLFVSDEFFLTEYQRLNKNH